MTQPDRLRIEPLAHDFQEWDALLSLILRAFAYMDGVIDPPSSAKRLNPDGLRRKARAETCFVARHGGELAGCVFVEERDDCLYVGKLAVAPSMQGSGIGAALMLAAERLARERGKPVLELQTRIELTGNHAAFARLGFHEIARTAHAGYERPTSLTLRKVLA